MKTEGQVEAISVFGTSEQTLALDLGHT